MDFLRKNRKVLIEKFDGGSVIVESDELDALVVDEMSECVRAVIDGLSPDHRAAIVLSSLQGLSIAETADVRGISVNATKVRIHRAKAKLKEALTRECDFYRSPGGAVRCEVKSECSDAPGQNGCV